MVTEMEFARPVDGVSGTMLPPTPGKGIAMSSRDERGNSLTAFIATVMVALLVMIGLVIDGGAASVARRLCHMRATEAARAASDLGAVRRAAGLSLDESAVRAAVEDVMARTDRMTSEIVIEGDGTIMVTARLTVKSAVLSLIGINELSASSTASAQLFEVRRR